MSTAGIIVIGNEVLSGKVNEANASFLIRELREIGVDLGRVVVIRDDVEVIASDVRFMSRQFDHVFTSGGLGTIPKPQLPTVTEVTPCQPEVVQCGSQNTWAS